MLIRRRVIEGTVLAAYGHGDWNDSLQPVDPQMRERLCSAWTVTLHHQTLVTLASALRRIDPAGVDAVALQAAAVAVREDFQRFLVVDGVLKTLAENGNFSAIAAVLLPTVGLMLVGVWLALQKEERK